MRVLPELRFAVAPDGRMVHVDEVANGLACQCSCPECRGLLIARNGGQERVHHFAHAVNQEGLTCAETALHRAAKQVLARHRRLRLPERGLWEGRIASDHWVTFETVTLERRFDDPTTGRHLVADCWGEGNQLSLVVEIAVSHLVTPEKAGLLRHLGIPAVEIDLADEAATAWDWERLAHAVLEDPARRRWIVPVEPPAPSEEARPTAARVEQVFVLPGGPVWMRPLPYGNWKVFHFPSEALRAVVEPLCRGRGQWHRRYKAWVVYDWYAGAVIEELRSRSRSA